MKLTEEQKEKLEACVINHPPKRNTVAAVMRAGLLPELLVNVAELATAMSQKECRKIMDECPIIDTYALVAAYNMGYMQRADLEAAKMAMCETDVIYGIPKKHLTKVKG